MGRGSAYPHQYFMLFDYDHDIFKLQPDDVEDAESVASEEAEFYEGYYNVFLQDVAAAFGTDLEESPTWISREMKIIAENDRVQEGIDSSGGLPCIFVQAKTYVPWNAVDPYNEKEYNIRRDVTKGFSTLIKLYNRQGKRLYKDPMFCYPTSAWTASPYVDGNYVA